MFFKLVRTIYVYKVYNCYVYKVSRSCLQSFAVMSTKFRGDKLSYYPYWDNISKFWSGCAVVFFVNYTLCGGHERRGTPWKMENGAIVLCGGQTYGESSSYIG